MAFADPFDDTYANTDNPDDIDPLTGLRRQVSGPFPGQPGYQGNTGIVPPPSSSTTSLPSSAPAGFNQTKWAKPEHQTPKYQAGRILAGGGSIQDVAKALGGTVLSADRLRLPDGEVV